MLVWADLSGRFSPLRSAPAHAVFCPLHSVFRSAHMRSLVLDFGTSWCRYEYDLVCYRLLAARILGSTKKTGSCYVAIVGILNFCFGHKSGDILSPWKQNMAEAANVSDDWELCKENVQPLRQGRSFTEMSAAIQPSNATRINQEQEYVWVMTGQHWLVCRLTGGNTHNVIQCRSLIYLPFHSSLQSLIPQRSEHASWHGVSSRFAETRFAETRFAEIRV